MKPDWLMSSWLLCKRKDATWLKTICSSIFAVWFGRKRSVTIYKWVFEAAGLPKPAWMR